MALGFKSNITSMTPKLEQVMGARPEQPDTSMLRKEQESLLKQRKEEGEKYIGEREKILQGPEISRANELDKKGSEDVRQVSQQLIDKLQEPQLTFQPTKTSMDDLVQLFAMTSTAAFMSGGQGRYAGLAAMGNLVGALEGYQKGKQDLFKRELLEFDKNLKAQQNEQKRLSDMLQTVQSLRTTNRQEAEGLRKQAEALAGESAVAYKIRTGDIDSALQTVQSSITANEKIMDRMYKFALNTIRDDRRAQVQIQLQDIRDQASDRRQSARLEAQQTGRTSALNQRYAFNIVESFGQAATDLLNITTLPANTTLGMFAGMTGKTGDSLLSALQNTFARKVTAEDERLMQQMVSALDFHMSRALGGGYATSSTKSILDAYKEQVAQQGDSPAAQAMFLSRMKQELEILSKMFKNHPGANEGYVTDMADYVRQLNQAIPFNVQDVTAASRGAKVTMTDGLRSVVNKPSNIPLPVDQQPGAVPQQAPVAQPIPSQTTKEGQEAVSKSGKPIIFRNGQWEYK